jgi:hypothetical protein
MKGLPRRPRRVAQTHAVAEKQKYLAVPYGDERERGQIVLSHFHFKTDTKSLRTVIKSKPENRNVKVQDLTATSSLARLTLRRDRDMASFRKNGSLNLPSI